MATRQPICFVLCAAAARQLSGARPSSHRKRGTGFECQERSVEAMSMKDRRLRARRTRGRHASRSVPLVAETFVWVHESPQFSQKASRPAD